MSNSSFSSRFSNRRRNAVNRLDDFDFDQIKFGMPTKKGPQTFIPVTYKGKPLKFQARGVSIGFVGHSTKKDAMDTPLLDRNFYFSINAGIDECPEMPGNVCDGPSLFEFHKAIENKFKEYIKSSKEVANKMKATYKARDEETGKQKLKYKSLIPLWSDSTPILDRETEEETGEFYPPSIMYKLRPSTVSEKGGVTKVDSFTTTFKDRRGRELPIKPSNVNGSIPRGSFGILNVSMPRIWIGAQQLKFTVYLNDAKLVIVDTTEETDDFADVESDSDEDDFKEEGGTGDVDDPDAELDALEGELDDI